MSRKPCSSRAITLVELIISIILLALVVLGFFGIEVFSRYHLLTSDRRAKLQNEASYLVEHMTKNLVGAMGDFLNDAVVFSNGDNTLTAHVDSNADGIRDPAVDRQVRYCYSNGDCNTSDADWAVLFQPAEDQAGELLVRHITDFSVGLDPAEKNLLVVSITACWDPDETTESCGSPQNPTVSLQTTIRMPSVSTN